MSCEHGNDPSTCSWCLTAAHDWEAKALAREAEALRVERWHATFNAALSGYCTDSSFRYELKDSDKDDDATSDESRRRAATWQADAQHGPLVKP